MKKHKQYYYNVYPRYTSGSPAMVSESIALKVAAEEKHFIEHALDGAWGEVEKARAEKLGLRGIVEAIKMPAGPWVLFDGKTEAECMHPQLHVKPQ